jgi:hypothetical protein
MMKRKCECALYIVITVLNKAQSPQAEKVQTQEKYFPLLHVPTGFETFVNFRQIFPGN